MDMGSEFPAVPCYFHTSLVVYSKALPCSNARSLQPRKCAPNLPWPRLQRRLPKLDRSVDRSNHQFTLSYLNSAVLFRWSAGPFIKCAFLQSNLRLRPPGMLHKQTQKTPGGFICRDEHLHLPPKLFQSEYFLHLHAPYISSRYISVFYLSSRL